MMNLKINKIFLSIFLILSFFGCKLFTIRGQVITNEEFLRMVNTDFNTVDDVIKLFPQSVADVEKRVELNIENAKNQIDKIINLKKEERTFDNTMRALDLAGMEFGIVAHGLEVFELVSPDKEIRDACHEASIEMQQFAVDAFSSNVDLYNSVKEYDFTNAKKEKLSSEEEYFLEETIKDFERNGLNLPKEKLEEVKRLKKEIAKLSLDFEANIAKDKSQILVDRNELEGLQDHFIDNLKQRDGKFVLACDYPTYFEVMQNCRVTETRKKLSKIFSRRAYPINEEILNEVVAKRDELAKLLGFDSYAAFELDDQMAKNTKTVDNFLTELATKTQKKELKEFEVMSKELPEGVELTQDGKFYPWDYSFVKEQYKKKHFNVDENEISEYFPVQKTIDGIFNIYQQFLGLEFKTVEILRPFDELRAQDERRLWHEDVKFIEIYDRKTNQLLGYLFLDLYPRDDKYSHACMASIIPSIWRKDEKTGEYKSVPAVITVIANFPKATKDRPALLKHNDVETFFHEFGHAMHGLLGKTKIASFSGTDVKRDFVEMPSQMFEEWMWDKDILKLVSHHFKTGESLPDELIDKKIELKKFDSGFFVTRQCWLSFMSLDYFMPGAKKDLNKIKKDLHNKLIKTVLLDDENEMQCSFGHLMGYGAKYYGYMWSKVFALDLFEQIKKAGLLSEVEGRKLIDDVLGKGGSVEPNKLLFNFLGREPNQKAFLKDLGLE
ncbi:MAG: M3 family metallopeptidase [bacterium]